MASKSRGLAEYSYIDGGRLHSYFEQISSPVKYDKVPTWRAGLKLTGPEADTTQSRFGRPFTHHEMIGHLIDYLTEQGLIQRRPMWMSGAMPDRRGLFVLENLLATRAFIPPRKGRSDFPGMGLWIGRAAKAEVEDRGRPSIGDLYLLEAPAQDDRDVKHYSAFSALAMLLDDMGDHVRSTVLTDAWELDRPTDRIQREFATDPVGILRRVGASIGATKEIAALYRIRATFAEKHSEPRFAVTIIGYPIVIADAGSLGTAS